MKKSGSTIILFENMIQDWFAANDDYNDFIRALLMDDLKAMNVYMNRVTTEMFSSFDSGTKPSEKEPERFYHGFVLEPRGKGYGIIMEFKVQDEEEKELKDTVEEALRQIEEKKYQSDLIARGIPRERIRKYGFAFCGKKVLIGRGAAADESDIEFRN